MKVVGSLTCPPDAAENACPCAPLTLAALMRPPSPARGEGRKTREAATQETSDRSLTVPALIEALSDSEETLAKAQATVGTEARTAIAEIQAGTQ